MLQEIVFCSPDFAESFAGSTLARFDTQKNPKNPVTLEEPRKDGQRSTLLSREILPQDCEKLDASNVRFQSHLVERREVERHLSRLSQLSSFFLSWVSKTQPNH